MGTNEVRDMTKHPTFHKTIVNSKQWQLWVKENEQNPQFDVNESMECNWLSTKHWLAFLNFCRQDAPCEICSK